MNMLESICIHNGQIPLLPLHQQRMTNTCHEVWNTMAPDLLINIPSNIPLQGTHKWRIVYHQNTIIQQTLTPYTPKAINSLQCVHHPSIDYTYKREDRALINELFNQRQTADDILIIKNGFLTDTSYCNIVLHKQGQLFTPQHCLLQGVQRQYLVDKEQLKILPIHWRELHQFTHFQLINAMIPLHQATVHPISNIRISE